MTKKVYEQKVNLNQSDKQNQKVEGGEICGTINIENVIHINQDGTLETTTTVNNVKTKQSQNSPTFSQRSTSISISSIESDALSSIIDSDVDEYEDSKTGCMLKKLGQQTSNPPPIDISQIPNIDPEIGVLISQQIDRDVGGDAVPNGPKIASLSIDNSTDVTFGSKRFLHGPVTIQQILVEKPIASNLGKSNQPFDELKQKQTAKNGTQTPNNTTQCETQKPTTPSSSIFQKKLLNNKVAFITALIIALATLIGIILILATFYFLYYHNVSETSVDEYEGMISRDHWVAQPPNVPSADLQTPVSRVIISHTSTQNCTTKAMCIFRTRFIQTFNIESRSYDDIRYNFLVGGDGNVYVGRGWNKVGAHTKGFNDHSLGIAFIGTFNKYVPPDVQLNATKWLLEQGVRLNKIVPDYKIYGSRQMDFSDSPGEMLFKMIQTWPNWSDDV